MNNLSWFLYLADVIASINTVIGLGVAAVVIIGVLWLIGMFIRLDDVYEQTEKDKIFKEHRNVIASCTTIGFTLLVIMCLIPSKQTMYAIAASQTVDYIAHTPQGLKAQDILTKYLDKLDVELTSNNSSSVSK